MKKMGKINCDIVVITHRIWTDGKRKRGGLDKVVDHFISRNKKVLIIEHPLEGLKEMKNIENRLSLVTFWENGAPKELFRKDIRSGNKIASWTKEVIFNDRFLKKRVNKGAVLFSSDPLNNLTGIFLRNYFSRRYFHCVDFSYNRFGNLVLNWIYKTIFKLTFRMFDLIGVVSILTQKEIIKNGCLPGKLLYIPNSPEFKDIDLSQEESLSLISAGGAIIKKYDCDKIIDILNKLKKVFPSIKLYFIGGLQEDPIYVDEIKKKIKQLKLEENIDFTGFLNPEELEKYLIKSSIGFSFYAKNVQYYTKFGDSLKMREYAMYGIPTISDGNSATDEEMQDAGAGFIIKSDEEAAEKIAKLINDRELYIRIQKNCIDWAKINDKSALLKTLEDKLAL
jgi:glycosyltransferase involved in cell wall biosynthesis